MADDALVLVDGTDLSFRCAFDEPVLDAALAAGVQLPHQCRGASCGTCKSEVLQGEVAHGWSLGLAITDEEREAGLCLACQAMPRSPLLRIRPLQAAASARPPAGEFPATVLANQLETPRVRRLVLAIDPSRELDAPAGSYAEMRLPGVHPNRRYSFVHAPGPEGLAEFWVASHPGGAASGYVHERLRVGDEVVLEGPYGSFRLPEGDGDVVAMAGGTGLAPIVAVLDAALRAGLRRDVVLLSSVRGHAEILGLDRLERLARRHPNFRYEIACTDGDSPLARHRETLDRVLPRRFASLAGRRVLASGSPGFVAACMGAARALGVGDADIATDSFDPVTP
jgi:CDP-4-dehydro-6-deoxyglucose reductase